MTRYFGLLLVGLVVFQAQAAESTLRKDVLLWYDACSTKDPALLERILSPQWVDIPAPPGQPAGPEGAKNILKRLSAAFPDLTITVNDIVQQDNKVVVRSEITGTHKGEFLGRPGTGGELAIQAIDIHEFDNGKIIRTWHSEDWMTGLHQLRILGE
jgi:steroid delta-isomerase-like uncharacterized protein